jgi:hypothetical protein
MGATMSDLSSYPVVIESLLVFFDTFDAIGGSQRAALTVCFTDWKAVSQAFAEGRT